MSGFYLPPSPLPAAKAGTLIRSEELAAPPGVRGWRILYHSRNSAGTDIAVSGAVFIPTASPPSGGRRVVAWAHGTAGLGDACAPSSSADALGQIPQGAAFVAAGDAVVATDYEGLGTPGVHPYLVGVSEGRSVLDAVRGAAELPGAELSSHTVVFGHSQGGHAALFTDEIAHHYAPEITLDGVVAAAPPTDLSSLAAQISDLDDGSAYLLLLAGGYGAADPTAKLDSILTPTGAKVSQLLVTACVGELIPALKDIPPVEVFARDPRLTEPWSSGLRTNSVGRLPTRTPLLILQGGKDPIVPASVTSQAVKNGCGAGNNIDYVLYPSAGHDVVAPATEVLVPWVADRFAGRPTTGNC